ncbi:hypothetical protein F4861DRAFT_540758 [Xylaria intraflava]|nr:hypothetical protein F4861DRAFT_540758 [Xylaria intraflava]
MDERANAQPISWPLRPDVLPSSVAKQLHLRLAAEVYLRACIDYLVFTNDTPGTLNFCREAVLEKSQPLIVDGDVIPPGTQVGVNIYSPHHNEEYFPQSFKFLPDRWLSGAEMRLATYDALSPFFFGSGDALARP